MSKRWGPGKREAQRDAISQWRPWEASSGPVTEKGKAVVGQNATTHGTATREALELKRAVTAFIAGVDLLTG